MRYWYRTTIIRRSRTEVLGGSARRCRRWRTSRRMRPRRDERRKTPSSTNWPNYFRFRRPLPASWTRRPLYDWPPATWRWEQSFQTVSVSQFLFFVAFRHVFCSGSVAWCMAFQCSALLFNSWWLIFLSTCSMIVYNIFLLGFPHAWLFPFYLVFALRIL